MVMVTVVLFKLIFTVITLHRTFADKPDIVGKKAKEKKSSKETRRSMSFRVKKTFRFSYLQLSVEKIKTRFLTLNSCGLFENDCCLPEAIGSIVSAIFDRWLGTERI